MKKQRILLPFFVLSLGVAVAVSIIGFSGIHRASANVAAIEDHGGEQFPGGGGGVDPNPPASAATHGTLYSEYVPIFGCDIGAVCNATCNGSFRTGGSGTGWSVSYGGTSISITNDDPAVSSTQTQSISIYRVDVDDDGSGTGWSKYTCPLNCSEKTGSNCATTYYPSGTVWTQATGGSSVSISGSAINELKPNGTTGFWGGFNAYYSIMTLRCDSGYVVSSTDRTKCDLPPTTPPAKTASLDTTKEALSLKRKSLLSDTFSVYNASSSNGSGFTFSCRGSGAASGWITLPSECGGATVTSNSVTVSVAVDQSTAPTSFKKSAPFAILIHPAMAATGGVQTSTITISATAISGTSSVSPTTKSVTIEYDPEPLPVVTLSASPATVPLGATTTLAWSATNSPTSCTASSTPAGVWSSTKTVSGGSETVTVNQATTFSITCTNAGGSASDTKAVSITSNPVTCSSYLYPVSPSTFPSSGGSGSSGSGGSGSPGQWAYICVGSTVQWEVSSVPSGFNAYAHQVKNGVTTLNYIQDSTYPTTNLSYNYTYTAGDVGAYQVFYGIGPNASSFVCTTNTVSSTVLAATDPRCSGTVPSPTLTVVPSSKSIIKGGTASFAAIYNPDNGSATSTVTASATWSSASTTVATSQGSGSFSGVGRGTAVITASYSGLSQTASLTVTQPTISLNPTSWSPSAAQGDGTSSTSTLTIANTGDGNLTWTATTSTSSGGSWLTVTPRTGTVAPNGSETVTMTVTNVSGLTHSGSPYSGTVTVSDSAATNNPRTVAVTYTINTAGSPSVDLKCEGEDGPLSISKNGSCNLTWTSVNAASCTASASPANSQWTGSKATSNTTGQTITGIGQATTFSTTCANAAGTTDSDSVTVRVLGVTLAPAPASGASPLPVSFTATVTGVSASTYRYLFDWTSDGTNELDTGTVGDNPKIVSHTYSASSTAKVTVSHSHGTAMSTTTVAIVPQSTQQGELLGKTVIDVNENGVADTGEQFVRDSDAVPCAGYTLSGVVIHYDKTDGSFSSSTVQNICSATSGNPVYSAMLAPGTYTVWIETPIGWQVTSPASAQVTVTSGGSTVQLFAIAKNDATCTNITAPDSVPAGAPLSATVTMKNAGAKNWSTAHSYQLALESDRAAWTPRELALPSSPVAPGASSTFTTTITATTTPGTYPFNWRMIEQGVEWFGGTCTKQITVAQTTSTHRGCVNQTCTVLPGPGHDRCTTSPDSCDTPHHSECDTTTKVCVNKTGAGTNQCATDADCGCVGAYCQSHFECQLQSCVKVGGPGTDQCGAVGSCVPQTYTMCIDNRCQLLSGVGTNTCSGIGSWCGPTHLACSNGTCARIDGTGGNTCAPLGSPCIIIPPGPAVWVRPETGAARLGSTKQFHAYYDGLGATPGTEVTNLASWSTTDSHVTPVAGSPGLFRCVSATPGATIRASYLGYAGTATLVCNDTPLHAACNATTKTCELVVGPPPDLCASSPECRVPPPPVFCSSFAASPDRLVIPPSMSSTLSWSCDGVQSCAIDGLAGSWGGSGNTTVAPTSTKTYTLRCAGAAGDTTSMTTTIHVFSMSGGQIKEVLPQ